MLTVNGRLLPVLLLASLAASEWRSVQGSGVELVLPGDWTADATVGRTNAWRSPLPAPTAGAATAAAWQQQQQRQAAISVSWERDLDGAPAWVAAWRTRFLDLSTEGRIHSEDSVTLHGVVWQRFEVSFFIAGSRIRQRVLLGEPSGRRTAVVAGCVEVAWDDWRGAFDAALARLRPAR
jgi:hypothetical protein